VTVEYPLGDPDWAVRHVLQYGPEAEVVGPETVRQRVAEVLRGLE
jgi:predicted DNA-binding transcriptional regulator YafY